MTQHERNVERALKLISFQIFAFFALFLITVLGK